MASPGVLPVHDLSQSHPQAASTSGGKLVSLQILRAFAAWLVVYHHFVQLFYDRRTDTVLKASLWKHGALGVDVFFVLSGFVMVAAARKSRNSPASFLIDRVFRIAPAYWCYSLLVVLGIALFPRGFSGTDYTPGSLALSALFLPNTNPSGLGLYPVLTVGWTLNFEMFFYASFAACLAISTRHYLKILVLALALMPIAYPWSAPLSVIARSPLLYEFLAGVLLATFWAGSLGQRARDFPAPMLVGALACLAAGIAIYHVADSALLLASSLVALALLSERSIRAESRLTRALVTLGNESYSTYLAHCVAFGIVLHFIGKNPGSGMAAAALVLGTLGTYAASRLSYRHIENSRRIARLKSRLSAALVMPRVPPASGELDLDPGKAG